MLARIHSTLFRIEKFKTYIYLWFLYSLLIVACIIKNF
ncbi:putative lipoprotein [Leptospira alstonii serovar Pingchang str. 80-412]|uniref:Lipoprotein n=2 Tax=Leptospira alstonii TaxID=28452 RepID=M6CRI7_9LEPT|nr:hypothetical protein LEP1GSC194_0654 [Leptospira alstonii serovar Sichuan str. 79601]EQA82432.1 putative lipoprotein [Leptospira alstonii serovar Pingchang str. 80-412]